VQVAVSLVFVVVYIRRMSSLYFVGQRSTAVDWMGELEVAVYFVLTLSNSLRMKKIDQNMGL
jgi:uncharacterized membrane protein